MQLQTNFRIDATRPVAGPAALRAREQREPRPLEAGNAASATRPRTPAEQAAILSFGAGALDRARGREAAATAPEPEPNEPQGDDELSSDQQRAVHDLQQRDREVRSHEQTHRSVGGQYAGSIHLDYQAGPDGERYAVSGSTPIDVSSVANDPEATLRKMEIVRRAATAPSNPSGADRQVAAEASHQAQQARAEMAAARYQSARELGPDRGDGAAGSPSAGRGPSADGTASEPFGGRPDAPEDAASGRLLAIRV